MYTVLLTELVEKVENKVETLENNVSILVSINSDLISVLQSLRDLIDNPHNEGVKERIDKILDECDRSMGGCQ